MRFAGKTAVITGGSAGIGRATVELFAREGASVIIGDIRDEDGEQLAGMLGEHVHYRHCDVCDDEQIRHLMDFAAETTGGIDIVFNNAGAGGAREPIDQIGAQQWTDTLNLLLTSVAMGIRHAAPHLKARGGGSIVNTSSVTAFGAGMGPTAYSTAKAAVLHLTKLAAADLAQFNIRVNAICPGFITTDIFSSSLELEGEAKAALDGWIGQAAAKFQPVARPGRPRDIAESVAYLASEAAGFVTGTHILVDGGLLVGGRHSWDPETPGMFDAVIPQDKRI